MTHKSEDYKISAVKYYLKNKDNIRKTCKIFDCKKSTLQRWIQRLHNRDKNILFNQLLNNENKVINGLTNSFTRTLKISEQKKFIMSFDAHYITENYQFLSSTQIYNKIIKLI